MTDSLDPDHLPRIEGRNVFLRRLTPSDAGPHYLGWLEDHEVVEYLECRGRRYTIETLVEYIGSFEKSTDSLLMGIFAQNGGFHIGNTSFPRISWDRKTAELSLMIGEKSFWGRGYGTEVIRMMCSLGESLGLRSLYADITINNEASIGGFSKNGFVITDGSDLLEIVQVKPGRVLMRKRL